MLLIRKGGWLLPRPGHLSKGAFTSVFSTGILFLCLQVCTLVAYEWNGLIVANVLGAQRVPDYSVPLKLFMFGPMLLTFFLRPLWPAYGEAIERGDMAWVRRTLRRSLQWSLLAIVPLAVSLFFLANPILRLWVGRSIMVDSGMGMALALFIVQVVVTNVLAKFLNGVGAIGFQVACNVPMALLNLTMSVWLTKRIGVAGVVWGSVLSLGLFVVLPSTVYISRYFRHCAVIVHDLDEVACG
jgi:O-antigen/teichoic acid export membrane protein